MTRQPLATPKDVAIYLGKPVQTLAQWRWLGVGPDYVKVGSSVRYSWEAVDAWLASQTTAAGTVRG